MTSFSATSGLIRFVKDVFQNQDPEAFIATCSFHFSGCCDAKHVAF